MDWINCKLFAKSGVGEAICREVPTAAFLGMGYGK